MQGQSAAEVETWTPPEAIVLMRRPQTGQSVWAWEESNSVCLKTRKQGFTHARLVRSSVTAFRFPATLDRCSGEAQAPDGLVTRPGSHGGD